MRSAISASLRHNSAKAMSFRCRSVDALNRSVNVNHVHSINIKYLRFVLPCNVDDDR